MMSKQSDALYELKRKIIETNCSVAEIQKDISRLEREFGADIFLPLDFNKKSKPWNSAYFKELSDLSIAGASSKEFILHMAEVKEYLVKQKMKRIILIAGTAVVIAGVVGVVLYCNLH